MWELQGAWHLCKRGIPCPIYAKGQGAATEWAVFKIRSWISGIGGTGRTEEGCGAGTGAPAGHGVPPCSQMSYQPFCWPLGQGESVSFQLCSAGSQSTFACFPCLYTTANPLFLYTLFRWLKLLSLLLLRSLTFPAGKLLASDEIPYIETEMQGLHEQNNNASHNNKQQPHLL